MTYSIQKTLTGRLGPLYDEQRDSNSDRANILPGAATVSFTNQYAAPATRVVFALEIAGYVVNRFNDVGSFAKGVTINHRFPETQPRDTARRSFFH